VRLKTKEFLELVLTGIADQDRMGIIGIDDIRVACHHLVVLDEVADTFEFGHFSVAEVFHPDKLTNKYYKEISQEFGARAVWCQVSLLCAGRIQMALGRSSKKTEVAEGKVFWGLFGHNIKETYHASLPLSEVNPRSIQSYSASSGDTRQPTQLSKTCTVGAGIRVGDLSLRDELTRKTIWGGFQLLQLEPHSHSKTSPRVSWHFEERPLHGTKLLKTLSQVDPNSSIMVAKVVKNVGDKSAVEHSPEVSTNQAERGGCPQL